MKRLKILLLLFLSILLCSLSSASQAKIHTLRELYKSGKITLKPILKISLDSIPDRISAKMMSELMPGKDKLYVSDSGVHDIKSFRLDGTFYKKFGIKGRGPGDTYLPRYMCLSNDRLVVWEIGNRRFSFFALDGKFLKIEKYQLKSQEQVVGIKGLDDGRIILETIAIELNKEKRDAFEWHVLTLYSCEMKYIKEIYRQKEHSFKYFENANPPRIGLPFRPQLLWDILRGNKIAVGFSDKYEIKLIDINTGVTKSFSHSKTPVQVTDKDKQKYLDLVLSYLEKDENLKLMKFMRDNVTFPSFKPIFKKIRCDIEGHILVFLDSNSDEGGNIQYSDAFDVFDDQGKMINHVTITNREFSADMLFSVNNNEFWFRESEKKDSFDLFFMKYLVM